MEDDDFPPPLEDMSEQITQLKQIKEKTNPFAKSQNDEEEVRLAPKKAPETVSQRPGETSIAMSTDYDKPKTATQNNIVANNPPKTSQTTVAPKQASGFGGMRGGFLQGGSKKPQSKPQAQITQTASQSKAISKPTEDLTHIKAKSKEDQLKFQEVQDAMHTTLEKNKGEWMNAEFFTKLSQNPVLLKAFTNPQYAAVMSEFGKNPQETMLKYGNNPEFRTILEQFSKMMGSHFEEIGDKKQKQEEEKMQSDPVMQIINTDENVKRILEDPKVKKVLDHLRFQGALDLHEIMSRDPETGMKMQFLIQKGVLNAQSTLPA